jgi:hypothetical protein
MLQPVQTALECKSTTSQLRFANSFPPNTEIPLLFSISDQEKFRKWTIREDKKEFSYVDSGFQQSVALILSNSQITSLLLNLTFYLSRWNAFADLIADLSLVVPDIEVVEKLTPAHLESLRGKLVTRLYDEKIVAALLEAVPDLYSKLRDWHERSKTENQQSRVRQEMLAYFKKFSENFEEEINARITAWKKANRQSLEQLLKGKNGKEFDWREFLSKDKYGEEKSTWMTVYALYEKGSGVFYDRVQETIYEILNHRYREKYASKTKDWSKIFVSFLMAIYHVEESAFLVWASTSSSIPCLFETHFGDLDLPMLEARKQLGNPSALKFNKITDRGRKEEKARRQNKRHTAPQQAIFTQQLQQLQQCCYPPYSTSASLPSFQSYTATDASCFLPPQRCYLSSQQLALMQLQNNSVPNKQIDASHTNGSWGAEYKITLSNKFDGIVACDILAQQLTKETQGLDQQQSGEEWTWSKRGGNSNGNYLISYRVCVWGATPRVSAFKAFAFLNQQLQEAKSEEQVLIKYEQEKYVKIIQGLGFFGQALIHTNQEQAEQKTTVEQLISFYLP